VFKDTFFSCCRLLPAAPFVAHFSLVPHPILLLVKKIKTAACYLKAVKKPENDLLGFFPLTPFPQIPELNINRSRS